MTRSTASALVVAALVAATAAGDTRPHRRARLQHGLRGKPALDESLGVETPRAGRTRCQGDRDALPDVMPFQLANAPFPSTEHPDVAIHVPARFDGTEYPGLVVFFHGWTECVMTAIGTVDGPCTPDGPVRDALHLAEQLDAARVNAILVAVQGRYDVEASDPGQLATQGGLRALIHELMVEHLNDRLGCEIDVDDFRHVVVASHSGGYQSVSAVLQGGGVPIHHVILFDSLYSDVNVFHDWFAASPERFDVERDDTLRWANVYTCCGGTSDNSRVMAGLVSRTLAEAGREAALVHDETTSSLAPDDLRRPIVFKLSELPHPAVPKVWLGPLLEVSGFAPLR